MTDAAEPWAYRTKGGVIIWQDDAGRRHRDHNARPIRWATADDMEELAARSTPLYLSEVAP